MRFIALLICIITLTPISQAVDYTMINRSVNLSNNLNYIVSIENSSVPLMGAQATFNYNPAFLHVNWIRQGNFLYYATNDAKVWNVWNNNSGSFMVISMVFFDKSILQTAKSTFMTINMKPLRKGTTAVNLTRCVLVGLDNQDYSDCTKTNKIIKIT